MSESKSESKAERLAGEFAGSVTETVEGLRAVHASMLETLREIEYLTDPELAEPPAKPAVIHAKARDAIRAAEYMTRLFTR